MNLCWPESPADPRQNAAELRSERELTDGDAGPVVTQRFLGVVVERPVPQVRVGIEAAHVGLEQLLRKGAREVLARHHLLHFERRSRPLLDERPRPLRRRLALLAPTLLVGPPLAHGDQRQRSQPAPRELAPRVEDPLGDALVPARARSRLEPKGLSRALGMDEGGGRSAQVEGGWAAAGGARSVSCRCRIQLAAPGDAAADRLS